MKTNELTDIGGLEITGLADNNGDEAAKKAAADAAAAAEKAAADAEAKRIADEAAAAEAAKKAAAAAGTSDDTPPEAVELDGVKYKLNETGDALNEDGTVFKTKAELDALEADNSDEPLVEAVVKLSGYELLDENGKPKKYEDTEEGLIEVAKDLGEVIAKKEFDKLIKSDPEFEEFLEYKRTGGKLEDFVQMKTNSWKAFKLDEENETQLKEVVMADLMAGGMSKEQAEITANMYKDTKRLKEFGKASHSKLVAAEEAQEEQRKQSFLEQQKANEAKLVKYYTDVKTTIDKGTLGNFTIPESEREDFYKFIAIAADESRRSKAVIEKSKLPLERLLQMDYLVYKQFDLNKLITNAAKTENVKTLRTRLRKQESTGTNNGKGADTSKFPSKHSGLIPSVDELE